MSNTELVTVQESCEILDSMRIPLNAEERSRIVGNIPYYGANGVQGYINDFIFDEELILLAEDGGYFEEFDTRPIAYKIKGKSWVNNHAHILRAKDSFSLDFVFYSLQHKNIISFIKGGTRSKLNQSELKDISFWKAPLPQQKKIAKILTTVDNLIEQTQALIDKYTAIKQGMMTDLFTRGIDLSGTPATNPNHGQLRPSFDEAPELYKETELGWVPRKWEVTTIGACCEISNNLRKPISAEEREYIKGEYAYYGCTGILDFIDEYRLDGKYVIIGEDGDHFLKSARQEMTLLINGKFNVNNHAHIVSGGSSCLTEWFHCYFVHRDITYYLTRQGAGRFKLKKETLLQMPMILPNLSEQTEIYFRYTSINEKQKREQDLLSKLVLQKKGLMQDLLTGKVQVTA